MQKAASQKKAIWVEEKKEHKSETAMFVHVCELIVLLFPHLVAVSNFNLPENFCFIHLREEYLVLYHFLCSDAQNG